MRSRRESASFSRRSCARLAAASALLGALAAFAFPEPAGAKVFHTRKQAIQLAFPDADRVDKDTHILKPEQIERVQRAARAPVDSKLVTIYTAWRGGQVIGYAHIDVHTVRTHPSALLVVWTPNGVVRSVRMLAFHEPLDYLPADKWYEQFADSTTDDRLKVGDDVHGVVNATLSTQVAADTVRRALAYHSVLIRRAPVLGAAIQGAGEN